MLRAGICGFGGLGHVHANTLWQLPGVRLVAVCDKRPGQLVPGTIPINVATGKGAFDIRTCHTYTAVGDLLRHEALDVLVTALPTDLHAEIAIQGLEAGCHVFSEKPMALTVRQCDQMLAASRRADRRLMIGQCLRFWPEYIALKDAIRDRTYGRLQALSLERIGGLCTWSADNWFNDVRRSGGAILDLHLHDVDWVLHALGRPAGITAGGRVGPTGGIDDVTAVWDYPDGLVVTLRGSWLYAGFTMNFRAMFDNAVLEFGFPPDPGLHVIRRRDARRTKLKLKAASAYVQEMKYFLDCARGRHTNERCPPESTRESIRLTRLEETAIARGRRLTP